MIVYAKYAGNEPIFGKPMEGFFIGGLPIIEPFMSKSISIAHIEVRKNSKPKLIEYATLVTGSFFYSDDAAIGIKPGTSLFLSLVHKDAAELLQSTDEPLLLWEFSQANYEHYTKFLRYLVAGLAREQKTNEGKLVNAAIDFWDFDALDSSKDHETRLDLYLGKKPLDDDQITVSEIDRSNVFHYHLTYSIRDLGETMEAVSSLIDAFTALRTYVAISITVEGKVIYNTADLLKCVDGQS